MKTILVLASVLATGFVLFAQQANCLDDNLQVTIGNVKKMLAKNEKKFHEFKVGISKSDCYDAFSRHLAYQKLAELELARNKALTSVLSSENSKSNPAQLMSKLEAAHKRVVRNKVEPIRKLLIESCSDKFSKAEARGKLKDVGNKLAELMAEGIPSWVEGGGYIDEDDYDSDESDYDSENDEKDDYEESETGRDDYGGNVQIAIQDERKALDLDKGQFEDIGDKSGFEKPLEKFEQNRRIEIERVLNSFKGSAKEFRKVLHAKHQEFFEAQKSLLDLMKKRGGEYNVVDRQRLTVYLFERKRAVIKGKLWMKYKQNDELFSSDFGSYFYDWSD